MATVHAVDRDKLEADAKVWRTRLAKTLESLGQREREVLDVKHQVEKHPLTTALVSAGTVAVVAGGTGLYAYRRSRRRRQGLTAERLAALLRAWRHPELLAPRRRAPVPFEILRSVTVGVVSFVIGRLAQRALLQLVPQLDRIDK